MCRVAFTFGIDDLMNFIHSWSVYKLLVGKLNFHFIKKCIWNIVFRRCFIVCLNCQGTQERTICCLFFVVDQRPFGYGASQFGGPGLIGGPPRNSMMARLPYQESKETEGTNNELLERDVVGR